MKTKPHICVRRSIESKRLYTGILMHGKFAPLEETRRSPGLTKALKEAARLCWEESDWFDGYACLSVETLRAPD